MSKLTEFQNPHLIATCGVGLRSPHYSYVLENRPPVSWFEVIAENFMGLAVSKLTAGRSAVSRLAAGRLAPGNGGRPIAILEKVRKDYPIVLHGVSLSIGSIDPLNINYLNKLKLLINRIEPAWISDHLCWTGAHGQNLHDLLPLPFTAETANYVSSRISKVQEFLGRQMLFENVSSYLTFAESEMTEWEFITAISKRSGCKILLDVNNIYVNSVNHVFHAEEFINGVPIESVGQFHLAGYSDMGTHLIDTHDHPVSKPVWNLYKKALKRFGSIPTLIEWDGRIPKFQKVFAEALKAISIQESIFGKQQSNKAPHQSYTATVMA